MGSVLSAFFSAAFCTFLGVNCPVPFESPSGSPPSGSPPTGRDPIKPGYQIELYNVGTVRDFDFLIREAANRWEKAIIADLPDIMNPTEDLWGGIFPGQALMQTVDDMIIGYQFTDSSTRSRVGQVGPARVREDGSPYSGILELDLSAFLQLSNEDKFALLIQQIGTILGIGSLWKSANCDSSCVPNGFVYAYSCDRAVAGYSELNLSPSQGTKPLLLVSNNQGSCRYWDDLSFRAPGWSELMTPTILPNEVQLITLASLGSLEDISSAYVIDAGAADPIPRNGDLQSISIGIRSTGIVDWTDSILPTEPIFDPPSEE